MNQNRRRILYVVVFVWFFGVLFLLAYLSTTQLSHFDPEQKLTNASASLAFDTNFIEHLEKTVSLESPTVVHFRNAKCDCNSIAEEHINSVIALSKSQQYVNVTININLDGKIKDLLPSTPAIAVIGPNKKLKYLGPYSAGYSCAPGNGIVERFIEQEAITPMGASVITDTMGCYCNTI